MKSKNKTVILALAVLCLAIVFLAIRNDVRFIEERKQKVRQKASLDSTARTQTDSLTSVLKNVSNQLDSIRCAQNEHNDMMKRDIDSIKSSLDQIKRIERQKLNSKK